MSPVLAAQMSTAPTLHLLQLALSKPEEKPDAVAESNGSPSKPSCVKSESDPYEATTVIDLESRTTSEKVDTSNQELVVISEKKQAAVLPPKKENQDPEYDDEDENLLCLCRCCGSCVISCIKSISRIHTD